MNKNIPAKISRPKNYLISCIFKDGFESTITLKALRDNCPAADSEEERKKQNEVKIPTFNIMKQGRNDIETIKPVGNYAINPVWKDGHKTGIYSYELLREIFENYKLTDDEIKNIEKSQDEKPKIPELSIRTSN